MALVDQIIADLGVGTAVLQSAPAAGWNNRGNVYMGAVGRGDNTPSWWNPSNQTWKQGTWWGAVLPWFVIYPAVNNNAVNARVRIYQVVLQARLKSTGQWTTLGSFPGTSFWSGNFEYDLINPYAAALTTNVQNEGNGAVSFKLTNNRPIHGGGGHIAVNAADIDMLYGYVEHDLILNGDAANAPQFTIQMGIDWYSYVGQQVSDFAPLFWAPAAAATRFNLVTTTKTRLNLAPLNEYVNSGQDSVYFKATGKIAPTVAEFRANPPPDPGVVTPPVVNPSVPNPIVVMFNGDSITKGSDNGEPTYVSHRGPALKWLRDAGYTVTNVGTAANYNAMKNGQPDTTGGPAGGNSNAQGGAVIGASGQSGNTLWNLLDTAYAEGKQPNLIIMEGGTNDFGNNPGSAANIALAYTNLVAKARGLWPNAKIIVLGTIPADWITLYHAADLTALRAAMAALDDGLNIFWADPYSNSGITGSDTVDTTHLTEAGAQKLVDNCLSVAFNRYLSSFATTPTWTPPSIGYWFAKTTSTFNTWGSWTPPAASQPPTLDLGTPYTFGAQEQQTVAGTYSAADPQGYALTYSITGGADSGKFNINGSTGALTFKVAPVYASPGSAAGTNLYTVVVRATSTSGLYVEGTVNIQVQQKVIPATYQVRAQIHRSAVGAQNVSAVVWDGIGGIVGTKLFEATGQKFLSTVNSKNQAEILIPVPSAVSVTNGQTVKVYLSNASFYTPIFNATVEQV